MCAMASYSPSLRVASLNVWGTFAHWPQRLQVLAKLAPSLSVDILLCQEVCRGGKTDQLSDIAEAFNFPHRAYYAAKNVDGLEEGVAIFSHLPLEEVERIDLGDGRPLLTAQVVLNGSSLRVEVAHISFQDPHQSLQVRRVLNHGDGPALLGADFNGTSDIFPREMDWLLGDDTQVTWPACDAEVFKSAWLEQVGYPFDWSLEPKRLDHIMARDMVFTNQQTMMLEFDGVAAADHALISADVSFA